MGTRITRTERTYGCMARAEDVRIASGHEDRDDLDVLRSDPALKMACGRGPVLGCPNRSSRIWRTPHSCANLRA